MSIPSSLLSDINTFLDQVPMGRTYFGRVAAGNSNVVSQLESGRTIEIKTANKIIAYMTNYQHEDGTRVTGLHHEQEIFAVTNTGIGNHLGGEGRQGKVLRSNRIQEPITYVRAPNLAVAISQQYGGQIGHFSSESPSTIDDIARAYVEGYPHYRSNDDV